jgi:predicted signal transduction protein with EAL and GGDEF domain
MKLYYGLVAALIDTSGLPKPAANSGTIDKILSVVFAFSASMAVLLIVVGGFRYILAHGDPSATAAAKNTVLYALIGLLVVMTAYSIVTFVVKGIG